VYYVNPDFTSEVIFRERKRPSLACEITAKKGRYFQFTSGDRDFLRITGVLKAEFVHSL
jgi:hypothetical protein